MRRSRRCLLAVSAWSLAGLWTLGWAAALAWTGGPRLSGELRLALVAGGLVMAASAAAMGLRWLKAERLAVQRHFDAICRLDEDDLQPSGTPDKVTPLKACSPWRAVSNQVRRALAEKCREVQDLKQAQAALEIRSQRAVAKYELIRSILAGMSEPIMVINDFDELVLANPAAKTLFGFDDAENGAERRALAGLVRCEKLVELLTSTAHHKSDTDHTDEIEVVDGQGQPIWYRARATKVACRSGGGDSSSPGGAVAVLRDIRQQKVLQKRNAEFVSSVSHEMKAPLSGIKAYIELLADGEAEDEETRQQFLEVITGQADRLHRLVDNLLNLARIEAGVVQVKKQVRSLNEVLEEAAGVVQPAAEAKQVELAWDPSAVYLGVLADRDMLLQAAINLLSNAVKYTPSGGRVTLRSRLVDDEVTFEVEDTGVGLSEEDCQRVFEKFYRVKKDKDMASGTGLGLPLAKHIVEDVHGGRLSLRSTLGAGSTFTVSLPQSGQMT